MIQLLSTYDSRGGAAKVCERLAGELSARNEELSFLVREKLSPDSLAVPISNKYYGRFGALVESLPKLNYPRRQEGLFSSSRFPSRAVSACMRRKPNLVHLHWVQEGFVRIEDLTLLNCPIVWTMHDSWVFTGGCHLPGECERFEESCGICPALGSTKSKDWSSSVWQRKHDAWKSLSLNLVAPSRWLADRAARSSLFYQQRVNYIPNGVDGAVFKPGDRFAAREKLGLPLNRRLLLFGAYEALKDPNKGFDCLRKALVSLRNEINDEFELLVVGQDTIKELPDYGFAIRNLGYLSSEIELATLYQASDLFVLPSLQENLPNMIAEAMGCGIPCVAFATGGIPDLIDHRINGYLARKGNIEDLIEGLKWVLKDTTEWQELSINASEKIRLHFSLEGMVQQYLNLYRQLIDASKNRLT